MPTSRATALIYGYKFISWNLEDENGLSQNSLSEADCNSKIYFECHGSNDGELINKIKGKSPEKIDIPKLATSLKSALPALLPNIGKTLSTQRITISLIVCHGGKGNRTPFDSAAAKLQQELAKQGIYADIMARKTIVAISPAHRFETTALTSNDQSDNEDYRKHQPNSKLIFTWATENGKPVQVAYDAYEYRQHQKCHQQFKEAIQELRDYAKKRKDKQDYEAVAKAANNLADNLEKNVDEYLNDLYPSPAGLVKFKKECKTTIDNAVATLATHRDPLWKRIIGKLTLAIASTVGLSIPYFIHKRLVKSGVGFSQSLFSNKTAGKILTDKLSATMDKLNTPTCHGTQDPDQEQQRDPNPNDAASSLAAFRNLASLMRGQ
ncbi:MAG: hypothetical protein KDH94_00435 [Coxiellaceae bacterium]|nr:hypothetical protein [Coxiellaceae bacterium]